MSKFGLDALAAAMDTMPEEQREAGVRLVEAGLSSGEYLAEYDPDEIVLDLNQPRKKVSDAWIAKLASLIYSNGLEQFPIVEIEDGKPLHRIGMCRILAYRKLKQDYPGDEQWTRLPVVVREYVAKPGMSKIAVVRLAQLVENYGREDPDPADEAESIAELVAEIGRDKVVAHLAEHDKKVSESWVSKRLALSECDPLVLDDCKAAKIEDIEAKILMNRIYKKSELAYQNFLDEIQEGAVSGSIRGAAADVWKHLNDTEKKPLKLRKGEHSGVGSIVDRLPNENSDYDDTGSSKRKFETQEDEQDDGAPQEDAGSQTPEKEGAEGSAPGGCDLVVKVTSLSVSRNVVRVSAADGENYVLVLPPGLEIVVKKNEGAEND